MVAFYSPKRLASFNKQPGQGRVRCHSAVSAACFNISRAWVPLDRQTTTAR